MLASTELRGILQKASDMGSISKTLALHSRGVDRADRGMMTDAYHPDADSAYGQSPQATIDFLVDDQFSRPLTLHRCSSPWIKVDGDTAISETYVIVRLETIEPDGPIQREVAGRYLDHHARLNDEWRIMNRTVVLDWNRNRPGTTNWPPVSEDNFMPIGGHRAADPARALLAVGRARFALNETRGETVNNRSLASLADEVASKQALHELLMAYTRGGDRADEELLASVFHPDAVVVIGEFNGSAKEYATVITEKIRTQLKSSFHSVANEWFEISGDYAVGECYAIIYGVFEQDGVDLDNMMAGRYVDSFERRDGIWKISQRTFVLDWQRIEPTSADNGGLLEAIPLRGKANREDPIYSFWNGW